MKRKNTRKGKLYKKRKSSKKSKINKKRSYKKIKMTRKKGGNGNPALGSSITVNSSGNYDKGSYKAVWRRSRKENKPEDSFFVQNLNDLQKKSNIKDPLYLVHSNKPINSRELNIQTELAKHELAPKINSNPVEFFTGKKYLYFVEPKQTIQSIIKNEKNERFFDGYFNLENCNLLMKTLSKLIDNLFDQGYINLDMKLGNLVFDFDDKEKQFKAYVIDTDPIYFIDISLLKYMCKKSHEELYKNGIFELAYAKYQHNIKEEIKGEFSERLKDIAFKRANKTNGGLFTKYYDKNNNVINTQGIYDIISKYHDFIIEQSKHNKLKKEENELKKEEEEEQKEEEQKEEEQEEEEQEEEENELKKYNKFVGLFMLTYTNPGGLLSDYIGIVFTGIKPGSKHGHIYKYMKNFFDVNKINKDTLIKYFILINTYKDNIYITTELHERKISNINYLIWYYCFKSPDNNNFPIQSVYSPDKIAKKMVDIFT